MNVFLLKDLECIMRGTIFHLPHDHTRPFRLNTATSEREFNSRSCRWRALGENCLLSMHFRLFKSSTNQRGRLYLTPRLKYGSVLQPTGQKMKDRQFKVLSIKKNALYNTKVTCKPHSLCQFDVGSCIPYVFFFVDDDDSGMRQHPRLGEFWTLTRSIIWTCIFLKQKEHLKKRKKFHFNIKVYSTQLTCTMQLSLSTSRSWIRERTAGVRFHLALADRN